jgi:hypothetical protein
VKEGTASRTARSVAARPGGRERASSSAHEPPSGLPLSALLSQVLVAFTIEAEGDGTEAGP